MSGDVTPELIVGLRYLIPGLIAAWVYYATTAFKRPDAVERIIQALIFTGIVQVAVFFERELALLIGRRYLFGQWTEHSEVAASAVTAVVCGLGFAKLATRDYLFSILRKLRLTTQQAYPTEWYGAFFEAKGYIVLQLKDGRRLMGWPTEWPSSPHSGHLRIQQAAWLSEETQEIVADLLTVDSILICVDDVRWVEFLKVQKRENQNDSQGSIATAPAPETKPRRDGAEGKSQAGATPASTAEPAAATSASKAGLM